MNWVKSHKVLACILAFVALVIIVSAAGSDKKKTENKTTPATKPATNSQPSAAPQSQPQASVPKYELVGEYGKGGRVYVIAPTDSTEEKLTLICKGLNKKYGSDSFARLSIFTDQAQAQIMANNPLDAANLEGNAATAYDKAYVAQLNINKSTGLKQCEIHPNGLDGENKEVKL